MSSETLATILFIVVVGITVAITFWASRQNKSAADYYAGGRSFSGFQNGLAISGDYMSAASFLGISGLIALAGYDGFLYSIGFLVAWLLALLLIAELLRNSGRFTMADQLAFRMKQRPVRTAAATSTVVVSIFYLLAQMVGAGALVTLLLGVEGDAAKRLTIVAGRRADGLLRHRRWHEGHHLGADRQGRAADQRHDPDHGPGAGEVRLQPQHLLGAAADNSGKGEAFLQPGLKYGATTTTQIDFLSPRPGAGARYGGAAAHPDPLLHGADRQGRAHLGQLGHRHHRRLLPDVAGAGLRCGGAAGHRTGQPGRATTGNLASPLLAQEVGGGDGTAGGAILLAFISAVAFATILAVVAGLTLTSASSVAHDLYATVWKRGKATEQDEVKVARIAAFVIGGIAIALAIPAQKLNIAFLVALAFAVAASANLPSLIYNLFWRRFNTRGAVWAIYGGLIVCVGLVFFSPVVSGPETGTALFPTTTGRGSR